MSPQCLLVLCGAPLTVRAPSIAQSLLDAGLRVKVAATAAAADWIDDAAVREVVGHGCFTRYADERTAEAASLGWHPDVVAVAPMTFNTLNKLAAGIADGYVPTQLCLALGSGTPIVAVPMFSRALGRHPAAAASLALLGRTGVEFVDLVTGEPEVRPFEPGRDEAVVAGFDPGWLVARVQACLTRA